MAPKVNCASYLPASPFEFYCLDLAEEQPDNLARISLHHPEAANCLQYSHQKTLETQPSFEKEPYHLDYYLSISSKRLDATLGALHHPGNSQHAPCVHQSSLVLKLLVDCCLGGVDQGIKSTPYYIPSWIEPFVQIFSQEVNPNFSYQEGLSINIQKFSLVKLPVAAHIHLIPIQLLPDFRVSAINMLRFEGIDLEDVTKMQICGQPLREGGLVLLKILKQPFVFQITGASATVGEYFQASAQTEITVSINQFDYGFRHSHVSIYKTQQQELVDLIDWTFKTKNRGGICCNSAFVLGPVGIGKSTFLKRSVADIFRYSRKEQVGVLEFDITQAMFEARKLDETSDHFAKRFNFQSFMKTGYHSSYLLVIYGLHTCTAGELKDSMLLALSRSLSSLGEKCYVLLECFERIPRALEFLQSHRVFLEPPTRFQRKDILLDFLSHPITPSALDILTQSTHTYTPADLKYLATSVLSIHQCTRLDLPDLMASLSLEPKAIEAWAAERAIEETARQRKPGVVSSPPSVSFEQVGGYAKTKARLNQILMLLSKVNQTQSLGLRRPSGLLLVGPSGCGKTRLAQAFASHTYRAFGHHFLSVKGPSLFSQYFGGTEEAVRKLFKTARSLAPCTLFLDEIDALGPKRGWNSQDDGAGGVSARVLSTLLNELDGAQSKSDVFVVACTSFPHLLDDALIRPGRFDTTILVDIPTEEDRLQIISSLISHDFASVSFALLPSDLACLVSQTDGFTPADLAWILREAAFATLEHPLLHSCVTLDLILSFLEGRNSSIHKKDLAMFEKYRAK